MSQDETRSGNRGLVLAAKLALLILLVLIVVALRFAMKLDAEEGKSDVAARWSSVVFVAAGLGLLILCLTSLHVGRLPFWMFFTSFGAEPVTRKHRPPAYWYGIIAMAALGVLCLVGGTLSIAYGRSALSG